MTKPGHEQPEYDYSAPGPQLELPAELLPKPADSTLPPTPEDIQQPDAQPQESPFQVPETVRKQVQIVEQEAQSRYDIVDKQGQTTGFGTRERSGTLTPQDEDVLIGRAARRLVARQPKNKKKRTRNGLGSRQLLTADEPPAHILEENRRARGEIS